MESLAHWPSMPVYESNAMSLKTTLAKIIPLRRRRALTPGISIFGINLFYENQAPGWQAQYALEYSLKLKPRTVLDVGSGGGRHAQIFSDNGAKVDCIDFGTSIYSAENNNQKTHPTIRTFHMDFNEFHAEDRYDLIWASHILEHQRNVGQFIERLIRACDPLGQVVITVPDPHRVLCGGHLTTWTPAILAYNIVMCGVDLRRSRLIRGHHEFSIAFAPNQKALPALSFDYGDIDRLSEFFPPVIQEGKDAWRRW